MGSKSPGKSNNLKRPTQICIREVIRGKRPDTVLCIEEACTYGLPYTNVIRDAADGHTTLIRRRIAACSDRGRRPHYPMVYCIHYVSLRARMFLPDLSRRLLQGGIRRLLRNLRRPYPTLAAVVLDSSEPTEAWPQSCSGLI